MSTPSVPASAPNGTATLTVVDATVAAPAAHGVVDAMAPAVPLAQGGKSELVALPYALLMIAIVCVAIGALKSRGNRR